MIYAKKTYLLFCLLVIFAVQFTFHSALYAEALPHRCSATRSLIFFLQSATKMFLFTRTRNQFATSIFHAHTCKHTPVWGRGAATDLILSCR